MKHLTIILALACSACAQVQTFKTLKVLTGGITSTGTISTSGGNVTSSSTGNAAFNATGGAFGDGYIQFNSNSATQAWITKSSGTTGNYVIRDNTAGADYLTITKATGAIAVPGALTATGTLTTNSGNVTSTSSGSAGFVASAGAFGSATVDLKSNSATQRWIAKSDGGSGNFVVRDETATTDYFTITKATGAVAIPGALTVGSCTGCATPAGSNTQIQFNNSGALGASANLTWNGSTVAVTGAVTASGTITGNTLTASTNSNLAIASASSMAVSGALTVDGGAGTWTTSGGGGGNISANSVTTTLSLNAGTSITAGTNVVANGSYGFKVGGTTGLSPGATQTLTVRDSAGTGTCTITVIGGIISATTC